MATEEELQSRAEGLQATLKGLSKNSDASLTADEQRVLDLFWNDEFHQRRGSVPLAVVLFLEAAKLTGIENSKAASALVSAWVEGLVKKGYISSKINTSFGMDVVKMTNLELTLKGADFVAAQRPGLLRQPTKFAQRHLKLWQLVVIPFTAIAALIAILKFFGVGG